MSEHSFTKVKIMRTSNSVTKELISRTALELFVQKGMGNTTIRDISQKGKVAEGTLYRYYYSKEQMAKEVYQELARVVQKDFTQMRHDSHDFESFLSSLIIYLCQMFDRDEAAFQYIFLLPPSDCVRLDITADAPEKILEDVIAETFVKRGQGERDAALVTAQIMGSILHTVQYKMAGRLPHTLSHYADELVFAVFRIVRE